MVKRQIVVKFFDDKVATLLMISSKNCIATSTKNFRNSCREYSLKFAFVQYPTCYEKLLETIAKV